ncbi:MAG: hypothetical protein LIP00_09725 [Parabacteroides sp.]|nr:hypothetical protein [Parabacteroides sp.]
MKKFGTIKMSTVVNVLSALFVFSQMVDPGDVILRLKLPLFALLLVACVVTYPRIDLKLLRTDFLFYGILILSTLTGLFAAYKTDYPVAVQLYKTFVMIWLLPWCRHLRFLEYLLLPGCVIGFIVIAIYIAVSVVPGVAIPVSSFFTNVFPGTMFLSRRTFLGIDIVSVYYTSIPVLLLFVPVMQKTIFGIRNASFGYKTTFVLILFALVMGGTRALIGSVLGIIFSLWVIGIGKKKGGKPFAVLIGFVVLAAGIALLYLLLNDKGEQSLEIKSVLAQAFYRHVGEHPGTLVWGNGVGAVFDSLGVRGDEATLSELSYFELIRWFGIPLTVVFMAIYIYPVFLIYKKRNRLLYGNGIVIGYLFYLLLASTNPYLIGSNGLLALLIVYSYAYNPFYGRNE